MANIDPTLAADECKQLTKQMQAVTRRAAKERKELAKQRKAVARRAAKERKELAKQRKAVARRAVDDGQQDSASDGKDAAPLTAN